MSRRAAGGDYVLVAVPAEVVGRLERFCRAIRIVTAPDPHQPAPISAPSAAELQGDLSVQETSAFLHLLFSFALDTYTKGARKSAAQCIVYHVFQLVTRAKADVAREIVARAKQDDRARQLLEEFFHSVGTDNWEAALDELIRTGVLQRSVGIDAQRSISTSNRDNGKFVEQFKLYIARQNIDPERKRRLTALYTALLVAWLLPKGAQAAPATTTASTSWLRLIVGAGVATALLAGIAALVFDEEHGEPPKAESARAEDPRQISATSPPPQSPPQPTAPPVPDCLKGRNGFEGKACLIREADQARSNYARAVALYKRAIAFDYDPSGLGEHDSIPERYLSAYQSLSAYDGLASLHSVNGQYRDALATQRDRLRLRDSVRSGNAQQLLLQSLECTILVALERRVNGGRSAIDANTDCMAKNPYPSDVDTDFHTYELARAYEDAGWRSEAIQAYAAVAGKGGSIQRMEPTRWRHLVDGTQEAEDSRKRLSALLDSMRSRDRALLVDDFALWIEPDGKSGGHVLGIFLLRQKSDANCRVDDAAASDPPNMLGQWQLTVESGGQVSEERRAVPGISRNSPRSTLPWYGRIAHKDTVLPIDVTVKLQLAGVKTAPRGCLDRSLTTRICILADGRLSGADRCP